MLMMNQVILQEVASNWIQIQFTIYCAYFKAFSIEKDILSNNNHKLTFHQVKKMQIVSSFWLLLSSFLTNDSVVLYW